MITTLIFVFNYDRWVIFLWAVVVVLPYLFSQFLILYFIFLILFVRENLCAVLCVLDNLSKKQKFPKDHSHFHATPAQKSSEDLVMAVTKLKKIYGILHDTSSLINNFIGLSMTFLLFVVNGGNTSAGYKIFLSFKGDVTIERLGSKFQSNFESSTLIFSQFHLARF